MTGGQRGDAGAGRGATGGGGHTIECCIRVHFPIFVPLMFHLINGTSVSVVLKNKSRVKHRRCAYSRQVTSA